ncbi:MAG: HAD-IB family phosphatase [Gammaproteobacteria bacterium]
MPPPASERAWKLAVFDLDGTITRDDTFIHYLRGWLRRHPGRRSGWRAALALLRYLAGGRDRGRLKSDLLRICMGGALRPDVEAWSADFAAGLGEADCWPAALSAIARHRAAGDRLVLLSASPDLYVPHIGSRFGFSEVISTGIAWQGDRLEGALSTPNRRGEEKRRCLEALRSRHPGAAIAAYANSASDIAHLAAADEPLLVNGGRRAQRRAGKRGIPRADWRNKPPPRPV